MSSGKFKSCASCPTCCTDAVVKLKPDHAKICAILNFIPFTSGIGTMVSACLYEEGFICNVFLMGFLQCLFAGFIGPYVWSIIHGIWLLEAAKNNA